ncbi:MAG: MurR/RpiR family transcriptional regulator [Roseburia sp.]
MESNPGIILHIQSAYNQLTKAEKKVASYVLENTEQVLYMSITDLADACQVGDTSVYRFCRTMKLQGYQEFKMQLSLSLAAKEKIGGAGGSDTGAEDLVECVMNLNIKSIQETYMLLDRAAVAQIVTMMEEAKRVFFFGIGDSLLMAEEARNKFLRITAKAYCISDPHMQSMAAAVATEEDLIVIISYSGATKDNIHVVKEAKRAGAKIASITHYRKSPLTAYSDAILLCGAKESPLDGGSMAVKMGQLFLIDVLYQEYYQRNNEECKINREKTVKAVVEKLY